MGLNSTELSLSLVLHSLETDVLTNATSSAAKNAIANIRLTLTDLLKREGPGITFLEKCNKDGEALYRKIEHVLGLKPAVSSHDPESSRCFNHLVIQHAALTERLNQVAVKLARVSSTRKEAMEALRAAAEWEQSYYIGLPKLQVSQLGGTSTRSESKPPLTASFLQDFLRARRHDNTLCIADFVPVPGGYGNQTFFCNVKSKGKDDEAMAIRKSDGLPIVLSLEQEYDLLRAIGPTGIPVPKVGELASNLPGVDGTFYTMNRIPGRMAASYVDGTTAKFSEPLLLGLAELLGKVHSIPLESFQEYITAYNETSVFHETNEERHLKKLQYWRRHSQDVEHPPSPYVTWLFTYLEQNIPKDSRRPILTHGDFNVHNILADGDSITALLDWECSDFGAPEMDLAYLQPTVSAHMDWNLFLDHYYKHGGKQPDPASMLYCAVYTGLKLALAAGRFNLSIQQGRNRDIRFINVEQNLLAAIMAMGLTMTKNAKGAGFVEENIPDKQLSKAAIGNVEVSHVEVL